jgi:VPDSG-CTERM motif
MLLVFGTEFAVTGFMKISIVPPKKFPLFAWAVCAGMLAFAQNASATRLPLPPTPALAFDDTRVVGTITPASPANAGDVVQYVNFMIGLAPGGSGDFLAPPPPPNNIQHITRSNNLFGSLPTATLTGAVSGGGTSIGLGAGGVFTYLFAKYDGRNDVSVVWNVAGLSGMIEIPGFGPNGHGLSGWILFGPGGGQGVPDGGATVMLLGAGLGALGMVRRYLNI